MLQISSLNKVKHLFFVLLFLNLILSSNAIAQNPGGVSTSLKAWYRADANVLDTLGTVSAWNNEVLGGINISNTKGAPLLTNAGLNFNPTIQFTGSDFMSSSTGILGSNFFSAANNTMFVVFSNSLAAANPGIIAKWESATKSIGNRVSWEINNNANLKFDFPQLGTGAGQGNALINGTKTSTSSVTQHSFIGTANTNCTTDSLILNGLAEAVQSSTALNPSEGGQLQLGGNYTAGTVPFKGQVSEIIYFDSHLTLSDRRRVESYLALKYGITLGNTSNPVTYLASDFNTKPWVGSTIYQNNIAGIGRDDNAGLNQKQSTSVNINSLVTMSLGAIEASNAANSNSFATNKSFLVWGDDNQALNSTDVTDLPQSIASRIARVWQTQETGTVGTVHFRYSLKGTSLGTTCMDYASIKLLVDKDAVFATGAKIISPSSYDNIAQTIDFDLDFNVVDGYYFTLGSTQALGSPIVNNISYCQNATEAPLTAIGNNLKWYSTASGGIGTEIAPTPSSATVGTVSYWVTQTFGSCESARAKININTKPIPTVTASNATICSGNTSNIGLTSSLANSIFSWVAPTQTNANGGSASVGLPTNIAQTLVGTTPTTGTVIYQVRATNNLCTGPATEVLITINPRPELGFSVQDTSICSGATTNIKLNSALPGTTFTWSSPTLNNANGGIASNGNQSKITQILTTSANIAGTVVYAIVATANDCAGDTKNITVTVNPKPSISANDTSICDGALTAIAIKSTVSGTTFSWNAPIQTNATGGTASVGFTNLIAQTLHTTGNEIGTVKYWINPIANGCTGSSTLVTATVNPTPTFNASDASMCAGNTSNILLTSPVNNTTFSWGTPIQTNTTGASASIGNPLNIAQTVNTTGIIDGTVKYAVVAKANNCIGLVDTVTLTVKPRPVVTANDTTICTGAPFNIALQSNLSNTDFSWTSPTQVNVSGGLASVGNLTSINQTLVASNSNIGTASYSVIPIANTCSGTPKIITVTVNPKPIVIASDATICAGSTSAIPISSNVSGATFSWENPIMTNASGGTAGTGNIIAQTLYTLNNNAGNLSYTISATANTCKGAEKTILVKVNPKPVVTIRDTTICSGSPVHIALKSNVGGTSFSWKAPQQTKTSGGFASIGNPSFIAQIITATDTIIGTTVYKIIANANACIDSSANVKVTVKPKPVITANDTAICTGALTNIKLKASIGATTFNWANPIQTNASGGTSGNTSFIAQTLTALNNLTGTVNYSIVPAFNGCTGSTKNIKVTVNTLPSITATATQDTICKGEATTLQGNGGVSYVWDNGVLDNAAFNPMATKLYSLIGTDINGCKNTASTSIVVNKLPTITATAFPDTICLGGSSTVRGAGAISYVWDNGVTDNTTFSPVATKTYTVTGTDGNGCENDTTLAVVVTGNVPPNITAIALQDSFCVGGSTTLQASGGDTYLWDYGVSDNVAFTPDATKTYTVIGTAVNGCKGAAFVTVNVLQKPIIIPIASKDSICNGDPVTLSGSGAKNYDWDNGVLDNAPFNPITSLTYHVTGTDKFGCIGTDSIQVVVNQLPIVSATALRDTVCDGGFSKLNGTGAVSYVWDNGITDNVLFSPVITKTYTVTGTDAHQCKNTSTKEVIVIANVPPIITAVATSDTVCFGESTKLTASGADTYAWDHGITNNVNFSPDSTRTYTVIGTDDKGCNNIKDFTIVVNQLPIITITSNADSICFGKNITLNGHGAISYLWDNEILNNQAFSPTDSKKYTVIGTDFYGCKGDTNITIVVNDLPTVTATSTLGSVCLGDSLIFNGQGANTYTWNNGVTDNQYFTPSGTKLYTVTGTDVYGCEDTDTITVSVKDLPTITATASNDSVCLGGSTKLTGAGGLNYAWDNNVTDNIAFSPNFTQTYTLIGFGTNGCRNTATTQVTVTGNIPPAISALASKDTVCFGDSTTLNGVGGITYIWDKNVIDNALFIPDSTRTYAVTATNARGCQNTTTIQVVVHQLPLISINATSDSICLGNATTLAGQGAKTYSWNNDISDNVPFTPLSSDVYTVIGTDNKGCEGIANIDLVVNTLPTVKANASTIEICKGDDVYLNGSGAVSYTWNKGVTDNTIFNPSQTTMYTVTGVDINQCIGKDSVEVTVNQLPIITATATATKLCAGNNTLLKGFGAKTYTWNHGISDSVAFTAFASKTYTLTGTDAKGCSHDTSISITVDDLPLAPQVEAVSICKLSSPTPDLNTKVLGTNVKWYVDLNTGTNLASTPMIDQSVVSATSYFVTQTDGNGCESNPRTQINVTVKDLPHADIISAQESYCKGKEYSLLLSTQAISGATYDWYKDGIKQNNIGNEIDSVLAGNWKVKVTLNACQDSSLLKKIEEKPVPIPVVIASGLAYCAGTNNINLAAKDTSSSIVYQWLNNGAVQGSNKFINNANAGNWTLVASLNGCADTSAVTTITEKSLPEALFTTPSDSLFYYTNQQGITLKAKDAGTGATYNWYKNGSFYTTTTVDSITDVKEGNWSLSVSKNGCSNFTPIDASVVELNLNPIALNDTLITNYLTNISWKITQNDYDPDGIIINKEVDLAVKQIGLQQTIIKKDTGIVFVDQGGFLTFVPDQNFTGTTVFEYTVKDNNGNESNIAYIVISVGPHIFDDYQVITTNTTGTIAILANDISKNGFDISKIDLDPSQAGVQSTIYKSGVGVYTVLPDGTVQIIPDENIEAVDSIYYQVSDLKGAYSNIAKIKVKIRSIGVIIPDGFSPNGDDNHDVLAIYNPAGHIINVEIYNRWGNLVYEKTNYKDEFSGKANTGGIIVGGELPDGTYFATFDIQRIDGSKEKLVKSLLIKR